jgi:hypothetical protein
LDAIISLMDEPFRSKCRKMYYDHQVAFDHVPGSLSKHQAWPGGLADHIFETAMIAEQMYSKFNMMRTLPFRMADVYLILFLHDIEKAWRYRKEANRQKVAVARTPAERKQFTLDKIREYGIELDTDQANALRYIEGEGEKYNPDFRVMNALSAFCHAVDTLSARMWYEYPEPKDRSLTS